MHLMTYTSSSHLISTARKTFLEKRFSYTKQPGYEASLYLEVSLVLIN